MASELCNEMSSAEGNRRPYTHRDLFHSDSNRRYIRWPRERMHASIPCFHLSTRVNKRAQASDKKSTQLDHKAGFGKSLVSNKRRLASVDSAKVRGSSEEGGGREVRRGQQVSVHQRLLGGRALRLTEQGLGGWTAAVLLAGVRCGH